MRTASTTLPYDGFVREMMNVADALNRSASLREARGYDYARNGGSNAMLASEGAAVRLPIDAWTTENAYMLRAYVPGVDPESVEIVFDEDELTIRGEFAPLEEGAEFIKRELFHGRFERRISFNKPVDGDAIEASYEQGVLLLRVPKAESVKPKQIKVVAR